MIIFSKPSNLRPLNLPPVSSELILFVKYRTRYTLYIISTPKYLQNRIRHALKTKTQSNKSATKALHAVSEQPQGSHSHALHTRQFDCNHHQQSSISFDTVSTVDFHSAQHGALIICDYSLSFYPETYFHARIMYVYHQRPHPPPSLTL